MLFISVHLLLHCHNDQCGLCGHYLTVTGAQRGSCSCHQQCSLVPRASAFPRHILQVRVWVWCYRQPLLAAFVMYLVCAFADPLNIFQTWHHHNFISGREAKRRKTSTFSSVLPNRPKASCCKTKVQDVVVLDLHRGIFTHAVQCVS